MEKSVGKLGVVILLATICACTTLAADARSESTRRLASEQPVSVRPALSKDFRIAVQTNRDTYLNRDVLRLAVRLLNNSRYPAFVGVCPIEDISAEPIDANVEAVEIEDVDQGYLDGLDVDVAIMPPCRIVIGYATLTRLGPSPVPCPVPGTEQEDAAAKPVPKKFRLPLFGSARVPAHSTRIISVANILIKCPLIEPEPGPTPVEVVPADVSNAEPIYIIPAVGRYVALRPGYYLLNCYIERICGTKLAQAQKIVRIRRCIPKPVPEPEPVPEPVD